MLSESNYEYNSNNSLIYHKENILNNIKEYKYKYNENDELIQSITINNGKEDVIDYVITIEGNISEVKNNKTSFIGEYNKENQLIKSSDNKYNYTYKYDDKGNRISIVRSDNKTKLYTYDEFNNLIKVKDYDDVIYEYTYDGLGHRLSQSVNKTYK